MRCTVGASGVEGWSIAVAPPANWPFSRPQPTTASPPLLHCRSWVERGGLGHTRHHAHGRRRLLRPLPGSQPGATANALDQQPAAAGHVARLPSSRSSWCSAIRGMRTPPMFSGSLPPAMCSAGHLPVWNGPRGHGLCGRGGRRSHAGGLGGACGRVGCQRKARLAMVGWCPRPACLACWPHSSA